MFRLLTKLTELVPAVGKGTEKKLANQLTPSRLRSNVQLSVTVPAPVRQAEIATWAFVHKGRLNCDVESEYVFVVNARTLFVPPFNTASFQPSPLADMVSARKAKRRARILFFIL